MKTTSRVDFTLDFHLNKDFDLDTMLEQATKFFSSSMLLIFEASASEEAVQYRRQSATNILR